jgi:hypothetical protein
MKDLTSPRRFSSPALLGKASILNASEYDSPYTSFAADRPGDGISFSFAPGTLNESQWLTFDLLVDGINTVVFELTLIEQDSGRTFGLVYGALNSCEARFRLPVDAVNQNRWLYPREGAWIKPICTRDRVDADKVTILEIRVLRKAEGTVTWRQTLPEVTISEPEKITHPELPCGKLVDEFGQSTIQSWPQKTLSERELVDRLLNQVGASKGQTFPDHYSRFGGWKSHQIDGTGYFRTINDGRRWWLVDPDGYLFWSTGMDCVAPVVDSKIVGINDAVSWLPSSGSEFASMLRINNRTEECEHVNYLGTNLIRAFGKENWYGDWAGLTLGQMKSWGFNTIANWSHTEIAKKAAYPYVRQLDFSNRSTKLIYRDFPDVFADEFKADAAEYAKALKTTVGDPALIGYFLMNEPTWGFSSEVPAAGMLFTGAGSRTRTKFREFASKKYGTEASLQQKWNMPCTLANIESGKWEFELTPTAIADLEDFSRIMVDEYFGILSQECRKIDPHHLNLGARYYKLPPEWAMKGMKHFDVFSVNCYDDVVNKNLEAVSRELNEPVIIGEWHFGALDVGLSATGIGHVKNQTERGRAFRRYTEDAAAQYWCVGVHYFTLYDQSCLGRFDGENYNIGFVDICNRPYQELVDAATTAHDNLYPVANGDKAAFDEPIEYLPKLFI